MWKRTILKAAEKRRKKEASDDGAPQTNLDIIDEDVPLANIPFLETIEDLLLPLTTVPRTTDSSMTYGTLIAMLAVSGMGILLVGYQRRKVIR